MSTAGFYALIGIVGLLVLSLIVKLIGITVIGNGEVGIVTKWWSPKGSITDGGIIALNGEAGFMPNILRSGVHIKTRLIYRVKKVPLAVVPPREMGYVFARSGMPLTNGQILGKMVPECNAFQDAEAFLKNGGQRGPQSQILREGIYAINYALFVVITKQRIYTESLGTDELKQIDLLRQQLIDNNGFEPTVVGSISSSQRKSSRYDEGECDDVDGYEDEVDETSRYHRQDSLYLAKEVDYDSDTIGIVTVFDGTAPDNGDLFAPIVGSVNTEPNFHNSFQIPEAFIAAGGRKGKQLQILTDGVYYINKLFADVELRPKTVVPIGYVGVVVNYSGTKGTDTTGSEFTHGELVDSGSKGVSAEVLQPGKYPINTYACKVILVPTTNVILNWIEGQAESHQLDAGLKEVSLITHDAFETTLPLTVSFNISYKKAPSVIQRFGSVEALVGMFVDPTVAGYFKNVGQQKNLLDIIQKKGELQKEALDAITEVFSKYDLELQNVIIGTPQPSKNDNSTTTILNQLREREIAKQMMETTESKKNAAKKEVELNEAKAKAEKQSDLTASAIAIEIAENNGKASVKAAEQALLVTQKQAEAENYKKNQATDAIAYEKKTLGEAEAANIKAIADAEAHKEREIGKALGEALKAQVDAYTGEGAERQFRKEVTVAMAEALAKNGHSLVPSIVLGGGSDSQNANAVDALVAMVAAKMFDSQDIVKNRTVETPEELHLKGSVPETHTVETASELKLRDYVPSADYVSVPESNGRQKPKSKKSE